MKAGFAKIPITPPVGSRLTGYAARRGVSTGIHDELFARAIVLEEASEAVALVSVEVLALAEDFVHLVRERIFRRTGIPSGHVLIGATHTHSGPVTIRTFFNNEETPDAAYLERLAGAIEECVCRAWEDRFPARAACDFAAVDGVGANRSDPSRTIDREAGILRVDDLSGRIRAVLVQYGCHATVLGFENLLVTADFPGMALKKIEESLGPGSLALFFNGAGGNVSVNHSSELNAIGVTAGERTFGRAGQVAERLASAVLERLPAMETRSTIGVKVANQQVELSGRAYEAGLEAKKDAARLRVERTPADDPAARRRALADELYASIAVANAARLRALGGRIPFSVQGVRLGETLLLAVPGELFSETGLGLKRSLRRPVFVIGLANGYNGYVPTREAFAEGGYESAVASCAPDSEQRLLEAAQQVEQRLFAEDSVPAEAAR